MFEVNHMVVLAGPPACGKSTILTRIADGELPDLPAKLGIDDFPAWTQLAAKELKAVDSPRLDKVIYHYDFLRQWRQAQGGDVPDYIDDPTLRIFEHARDLTFVTCWTQPTELLERVNARTGRRLFSTMRSMRLLRTLKIRRRLRRQQSLYGDRAAMTARYEQWLAFCARFQARAHYILDTTPANPTVHPLSDWATIRA